MTSTVWHASPAGFLRAFIDVDGHLQHTTEHQDLHFAPPEAGLLQPRAIPGHIRQSLPPLCQYNMSPPLMEGPLSPYIAFCPSQQACCCAMYAGCWHAGASHKS